MNKQSKREENGGTMSVVEKQKVTVCPYVNFAEENDKIQYESSQFEKICISSFCRYCKIFIFKIPSGTAFSNTGFLIASAKPAVKSLPGR